MGHRLHRRLRYWMLGLLLALPGCAGHPAARLETPPPAPTARALAINQAAAEIRAAPVPEGVEPALFQLLKQALLDALQARQASRVVSAPPAGSANAVSDLVLAGSESLGYSLEWTYVSAGDYNRDGEVNIGDLTPLGKYFASARGSENWDLARVADGNADGETNISDITPIGQNFLTQAEGYTVYTSTNAADYPAAPDGPNGSGAQELGTVPVANGAADRDGRLRFSFALPGTGQLYWVRPYFGTAQGAASNLLDSSVQLKPGTVILDAETRLQLADFSGGVLTFTNSTTQLAALTAGNIIVCGPLEAAPSGLLHRVDSVSGGGPVTVNVQAADLSDAVASANISAYIPLRVADVKSFSSVPGVTWRTDKVASDALGIPFYLEINDLLVDDADNNPLGTTHDQVHASGNLLLYPTLVFNCKIGAGGVEQFDFGAKMHVSGGLTFQGDVAADWDWEYSFPAWHFTPIVVFLGVFPLVIDPSIEPIIGADGNCTLEFTTSLAADAYVEGTLGYKDGSWGPHGDYGKNFSAPDPVVNGALFNRAYLGGRLKLMLYGLAGGTCTLTAGWEVDADTAANPWWTMCAGVKAQVGIDVLGLTHDETIFDYCWPLKDAGGPFTPPAGLSSWAAALDHAETADYDVFYAVLPLPGGRMVAAGTSFLHPILVLFDELGNPLWQYKYSEPGEIHGLALAADGGIIGVGQHIDDGLVLKVSPAGQLIWARRLAGPKSSTLYALQPKTAGGYFAVGEYITDEAFSECWTVQLNEDGSAAGSTTYGTAAGDRFAALARNPDGSFFAAGEYSNNTDAWLSLFDAAGAPLWHQRVWITGIPHVDYSEWATGVAADGSGGCYITGLTNRSALSLWLVRYRPSGGGWVRVVVDEDFALVWEVSDMIGLRDGGVAIAGQTGTAGPRGGRDGYMVVFSPGGGLYWSAAYGGSLDDGLFAVGEKVDGSGLFTAGLAQSFRTDNEQDAWALLLRPGGTAAFSDTSGAGRAFMSGNVKDDEDLTEHFAAISPQVTPLSLEQEPLGGSLAAYGAVPTDL